MNLHGHARLDLLRDGKTVHRVEKNNTITPWIANAIGRGNFHDQISPSKIMPIKQWFEGCLLTDVQNDPELMMIAGNANITAQASNDAYSGSNQKRGTFNTTESGNIENGYRFIWDWSTNQGNGDIASACLTRASIGAAEISDNGVVPEALINESLNVSVNSLSFTNLSLIDYENEVGYGMSYQNSVITIYEYSLSSKALHLFVESDSVLNIATHTINQTVANFSRNTASLSLDDNGIVHLFTWANNSSTINDYAINLEDDTCTAKSHTYAGVSFSQTYSQSATYETGWNTNTSGVGGNIILIDGDYILASSNNDTRIARCSLVNDADVELSEEFPALTNNGHFLKNKANGDIYKLGRYVNRNQTCVYYHNGKWYSILFYHAAGSDWALNSAGVISPYGTALFTGGALTNRLFFSIDALFPYVSTVANLDASVRKTADLTMKLSYEITEV